MAFKVDILGALRLEYLPFIIMLLINDFFGTMGTGFAMANKANLLDEDGNFPAFGKVFPGGRFLHHRRLSVRHHHHQLLCRVRRGVESGSRTGLSNLSTAFFFLLCMLFAPLIPIIPGAATGSASWWWASPC